MDPVGYHDFQVGMRFEELKPPKSRKTPRTVEVTYTGAIYHVLVKTIGGRTEKVLQLFRKQLSDPARWRRVA